MIQDMAQAILSPLATVQVFYKRVGQAHVFTSPDLGGLYIGNNDLEAAFEQIAAAIGALMEADTGESAAYELDKSYSEFEASLDHPDGAVIDFNLFAPSLTASRVPKARLGAKVEPSVARTVAETQSEAEAGPSLTARMAAKSQGSL